MLSLFESLISNDKVHEARELIHLVYEKITIPEEDLQPIISLLQHDKKNVNGQVNFVLLKNFEDYQLDCVVFEKLIIKSLRYYNS